MRDAWGRIVEAGAMLVVAIVLTTWACAIAYSIARAVMQ